MSEEDSRAAIFKDKSNNHNGTNGTSNLEKDSDTSKYSVGVAYTSGVDNQLPHVETIMTYRLTDKTDFFIGSVKPLEGEDSSLEFFTGAQYNFQMGDLDTSIRGKLNSNGGIEAQLTTSSSDWYFTGTLTHGQRAINYAEGEELRWHTEPGNPLINEETGEIDYDVLPQDILSWRKWQNSNIENESFSIEVGRTIIDKEAWIKGLSVKGFFLGQLNSYTSNRHVETYTPGEGYSEIYHENKISNNTISFGTAIEYQITGSMSSEIRVELDNSEKTKLKIGFEVRL